MFIEIRVNRNARKALVVHYAVANTPLHISIDKLDLLRKRYKKPKAMSINNGLEYIDV